MGRQLFVSNIAAIALIPSVATAQTLSQSTYGRQRSTRVVTTVAGVGGGVLGNVIVGWGNKTLGTVIGAVCGALMGDQIAERSGEAQTCNLNRELRQMLL